MEDIVFRNNFQCMSKRDVFQNIEQDKMQARKKMSLPLGAEVTLKLWILVISTYITGNYLIDFATLCHDAQV